MRVLQRRPTNLVDVWDGDRFLRVLGPPGDPMLVEVVNLGTVDEPDVRYVVREGTPSSSSRARLAPMLRRILGLDVDPELLARCGATFPSLRPTVLALRGMRPPRFTNLFETFANVVPFQQVSLDAGVAVVRKLVERFGESFERAGRRFHAFPSSRRVAEARLDALRRCGLSSRKADALRGLARAIESGALTEEMLAGMSSSEASRMLDALPGIGRWSASLVLLRGLGRLDVFPPGDVGAQRGLGALLRVGAGTSLSDVVERAGDYRGYLYFCALGESLLAKRLIHAAGGSDGA